METESRTLYCPNINLNSAVWGFSGRLPGTIHFHTDGRRFAVRCGSNGITRAGGFRPLGQLPFFIDFLKTAGLLNSFVADGPLNYESPNASKTRDVLGTAMLSMLAGHKRYSAYRGVARRRGPARASSA